MVKQLKYSRPTKDHVKGLKPRFPGLQCMKQTVLDTQQLSENTHQQGVDIHPTSKVKLNLTIYYA